MEMLATTQGWDHMMNNWGGWGMGLWWLISLGLLVLIVVVIWRLLQVSGQSRSQDSALDILEQRYARGDIDKNEFQEMRRDLTRR